MIELIFIEGPMAGVRFAVESDHLTIGRLSECDIELNQPNVSRLHAFIRQTGEQLQIIDNNSGNGTFVNERRIRQAALLHGDELRIGINKLKVEIQPDKLTGQEIKAARVQASLKPTRVERLSRFVVRNYVGDNPQPREYSSENLSIGRGSKCRLQLNDSEVSRMHATIQHRGGAFTIKDGGSANGTRINGKRVIEEVIESGDVIGLGNTRLAAEITGGVLYLTITAGNAGQTSDPVQEQPGQQVITSVRSANSSDTARKVKAQPEQAVAVPAIAEKTGLRYPIVRVLATVLVLALLLLFVGKNYAAIVALTGNQVVTPARSFPAQPDVQTRNN